MLRPVRYSLRHPWGSNSRDLSSVHALPRLATFASVVIVPHSPLRLVCARPRGSPQNRGGRIFACQPPTFCENPPHAISQSEGGARPGADLGIRGDKIEGIDPGTRNPVGIVLEASCNAGWAAEAALQELIHAGGSRHTVATIGEVKDILGVRLGIGEQTTFIGTATGPGEGLFVGRAIRERIAVVLGLAGIARVIAHRAIPDIQRESKGLLLLARHRVFHLHDHIQGERSVIGRRAMRAGRVGLALVDNRYRYAVVSGIAATIAGAERVAADTPGASNGQRRLHPASGVALYRLAPRRGAAIQQERDRRVRREALARDREAGAG